MADTNESPPGGAPPSDGGGAVLPENGWRKEYWKKNLRLMVVLLVVWFAVSFGAGILFIEQLNEIVIAGFPLGFWFAQQGSIYTFILLILIYALRMDKLDDEYGVSERNDDGSRS